MNAPLASTTTLIMELLIGGIIFYLVYQGYFRNNFNRHLAIFAIGYEVIFNVGYMIYRTISVREVIEISKPMKTFAAFHGILSLFMLLFIIIFFAMALRSYDRGNNYFQDRRKITIAFSLLWLVSIASGVAIYLGLYL